MSKSTTVSYQVTDQDVAQYWKEGYWISPKLIDDERIEKLRRATDDLFTGKRDGCGSYFEGKLNVPTDRSALRRVVNAWWVNDAIEDMVLDAGLGKICTRLMRVDKVRLWSDQVIIKPGTGGGETKAGNVGWHQDYAYWRIPSTNNMITAWIALQDTDLTNGGMRTLLGSHEWGLIEDSDTFFETDLNALRERFSKETGKEWIDEPCLLKAGQVSFHHALCFHGSGENRTTADRYSVVGHYMPDGTKFQPFTKVTTQLRMLGPRPQPGQPLAGEMFPLTHAK
jgi:ectoine hydroxylase-related dioxygenase (phytanoyl-CoA dioxygenase family)